MRYEGLLSLVQKRRSIRKFKPDTIPDDYIHKIIEAASWVPSGANSQPWHFVVIKKPDRQRQIMEFIIEEDREPG